MLIASSLGSLTQHCEEKILQIDSEEIAEGHKKLIDGTNTRNGWEMEFIYQRV